MGILDILVDIDKKWVSNIFLGLYAVAGLAGMISIFAGLYLTLINISYWKYSALGSAVTTNLIVGSVVFNVISHIVEYCLYFASCIPHHNIWVLIVSIVQLVCYIVAFAVGKNAVKLIDSKKKIEIIWGEVFTYLFLHPEIKGPTNIKQGSIDTYYNFGFALNIFIIIYFVSGLILSVLGILITLLSIFKIIKPFEGVDNENDENKEEDKSA